MTPKEAERGLVELVLPDGGRVMVEFTGTKPRDPGLEAMVVAIMFDAESSDGDVCEAIGNYAQAAGLTARYYLGRDAMVVALGGN